MQIYGIATHQPIRQFNLHQTIAHHLKPYPLTDGDVLVIQSQYIALSQGQSVALNSITPTQQAIDLATQFRLTIPLVELIIQEADDILGGRIKEYLLTVKDSVICSNAGIQLDAAQEQAILWPQDPFDVAKSLHDALYKETQHRIGIVIADSFQELGRLGNGGVALAVAGFNPIDDHRGKADLVGKIATVKRGNQADMLAKAAQLMIQSADIYTPLVLVKNSPITLTDQTFSTQDLNFPKEQDFFTGGFTTQFRTTPPTEPSEH